MGRVCMSASRDFPAVTEVFFLTVVIRSFLILVGGEVERHAYLPATKVDITYVCPLTGSQYNLTGFSFVISTITVCLNINVSILKAFCSSGDHNPQCSSNSPCMSAVYQTRWLNFMPHRLTTESSLELSNNRLASKLYQQTSSLQGLLSSSSFFPSPRFWTNPNLKFWRRLSHRCRLAQRPVIMKRLLLLINSSNYGGPLQSRCVEITLVDGGDAPSLVTEPETGCV